MHTWVESETPLFSFLLPSPEEQVGNKLFAHMSILFHKKKSESSKTLVFPLHCTHISDPLLPHLPPPPLHLSKMSHPWMKCVPDLVCLALLSKPWLSPPPYRQCAQMSDSVVRCTTPTPSPHPHLHTHPNSMTPPAGWQSGCNCLFVLRYARPNKADLCRRRKNDSTVQYTLGFKTEKYIVSMLLHLYPKKWMKRWRSSSFCPLTARRSCLPFLALDFPVRSVHAHPGCVHPLLVFPPPSQSKNMHAVSEIPSCR